MGSTTAGKLVLKNLHSLEEKFPELINLVAMATDDPTDEKARISARKRIWAYYNEEEKKSLFEQVLSTANQIGVPCYTGEVKTNYFRQILQEWAPDLIIMCCFGQKIDAVIFDFPTYGMYNFHPSDLKKKIGAGARPFHETMENDHKLSMMSIHRVNEEIDAGPVVGTSPPINICLADGSYPANILTLQEKIPVVCGWMTIELLLATLAQKEKGIHSPVHCVNYHQKFPDYIKSKLMEPASDDLTFDYSLPPHFLFTDNIPDGKD